MLPLNSSFFLEKYCKNKKISTKMYTTHLKLDETCKNFKLIVYLKLIKITIPVFRFGTPQKIFEDNLA
jgi:hypothetical protein